MLRVSSVKAIASYVIGGAPADHLASAEYVTGSLIRLRFSDGYRGVSDLGALGIDTAGLRLSTVRASPWGSAVEVEDRNGATVHIDSAVLRAYCDPQYAAHLEEAIARVK